MRNIYDCLKSEVCIKKRSALVKGKLRLYLFIIIQLQYAHKCLLRYLYVTNLAHTLLSFFLLFKKLFLTCDITAVALCKDIFAHGFNGFSCNNLASDGSLNRNLKQVARNFVLKLLTHSSAALVGSIGMNDK